MPIGLFSSWRLTSARIADPWPSNSAETAQLVPSGSTRAEVIMVPSRPVKTQSVAVVAATVGAPGAGVGRATGLPVGKSA
ncbi:hypothetical protein D3C72_940630 [compost metagenome]